MDWLTATIATATLAQVFVGWRLYKLQKTVEDSRDACLLYARVVRIQGQPLSLVISNLSNYDVWVKEVQLVVTRTAISQPGQRVIGGEFHLSRGRSESGLALQQALIIENGNVADTIDMDFYLNVKVWARDRTELRKSPVYRITWGNGQAANLTTLEGAEKGQVKETTVDSLVWRQPLIYAPIAFSIISLLVSVLSYKQSGASMRLSQAAYLYPEMQLYNRQELISAVANDAPAVPIFYGFTVTNSGNTPARNLRYSFNYTIPAKSQMSVEEGTAIRRLDIAPKQSRTLEATLRFSNAEGKNTRGHFFQTTLTGEMSYDDVFGETVVIPICYLMLANSIDARISNCPASVEVQTK